MRARIGVLTRNYPPMHGGMSRHAHGLVHAISDRAGIEIYAPEWARDDAADVRLHPRLDQNVTANRRMLDSANVDAWLCLSANFAPLVVADGPPYVLYFHGNDFLNPVIDPDRTLEARLGRVPGLWRIRDRLIRPLKPAVVRRRRRTIEQYARGASLILFNSSYTKNLATSLYDLDGVRCEVLHPGCDDVFYQRRERTPGGPLRLLTVSNLDTSNKRKNVDGVLAAIREIRDTIPCRYTVIGGGNDQDRLMALAASYGLAESTRFLGRAPQEALLEAYRESDLFILASRASARDVEGFGMVYIEANAAGMPVMASAEGGALDAVRHGRTGIVIENSSPDSIARGIVDFAEGRLRFDEGQIREHAESFRWRRIGDRFWDLFPDVGKRGPSA